MMGEDEDYVICGSEDGNVYIWNRVNQYVPAINPMYFKNSRNSIKVYWV